jgi:hypothetical protein
VTVVVQTSTTLERRPPCRLVDQKTGSDPEWHALRLFGRGRHPDIFETGAEKKAAV